MSLETVTLSNGTTVYLDLETRICSNGCGKAFKCLRSSTQKTARYDCKDACGRSYLNARDLKKIQGIAPDVPTIKQMTKPSDVCRLAKAVNIRLEGEYLYINDTVLFLNDKPLKEVMLKLLDNSYKLPLREVESTLKKYTKVDDVTLKRWAYRWCRVFSRNFGGDWFKIKKDEIYLADTDKPIYLAVASAHTKASPIPVETVKTREVVAKGTLELARALRKQGYPREEIMRELNVSLAWYTRNAKYIKAPEVLELLYKDNTLSCSNLKLNLSETPDLSETLAKFLESGDFTLNTDDIHESFDIAVRRICRLREKLEGVFPFAKWLVVYGARRYRTRYRLADGSITVKVEQ